MSAPGKILAVVDLPCGELDETGRGLLSYAARLGVFAESCWGAATLTSVSDELLSSFASYGTPSITQAPEGSELLDRPGLLAVLLAKLATAENAGIVLLPHNDLGATLAPIITNALNAALMTEVTTVRRKDGRLHLSRSVLGSRMAETRVWDGQRPLVITVPLRCLSQVLLPSVRPSSPAVSTWKADQAPIGSTSTVISRIPPDPQTVDLTEAEVIFSSGKGCDSATFEQLKELCRILNVSFGVTRPVYDMGWTGFERMVGQTGRTVTPRLYVALGISGSMHHVGGIKDSRRIISINNDPKAPIFTNSDEGFVADLSEIVPRLLKRAKASLGGAA